MKDQCRDCKLWSRTAANNHRTPDGEAIGACLFGRDIGPDNSMLGKHIIEVKASHWCSAFDERETV
jgi:hypothetical protein